jgi:hypothetical protein
MNERLNRRSDILANLLVQSIPAAEHGQLWLDAARRGYALSQLRKERVRYGYVALPVWEYLAGLARQAKISLDTALAAFELEAQPVVGHSTAGRIAEVLRQIGCPATEALQMIRLSFGEVHGFSVASELTFAHRAGGKTQDPDTVICEQVLSMAEAQYPVALRAELEAVRTAVLGQYTAER